MNTTLLELAGIETKRQEELENYSDRDILNLINKRLASQYSSLQEVTTTEVYNDSRNAHPVKSLPWYTEKLDKDIEDFLEKHKNRSYEILDIGTGPGSQAILLKKMGYKVAATDISKVILKKAKLEASAQGVKMKFYHDDILNTAIRVKFNLIIDRGCLHNVYYSRQRKGYVTSINTLLEKGGYLLIKILSNEEKRHNPSVENQSGPYRFEKKELLNFFGKKFKLVSFKETLFAGSEKVPLKGKLVIFQKV